MPDSNCLSVLLTAVFLAIVILVLAVRLKHYIRLSRIDEMTSVENYRGFQKTIKKIVSSHKKTNTTFSLAIFDIDEFRNYNYESYAFGDIVLKEFVQFLKQYLPEDAYIARFRFGDEFIIIIHSDIEAASEIIINIRDKCREHIFLYGQDKQPFRISFSYGVALFDKSADTPESLLIRTEKALKEYKRSQQAES
jgi:two-component system, cell cycle response regulator